MVQGVRMSTSTKPTFGGVASASCDLNTGVNNRSIIISLASTEKLSVVLPLSSL